MSDGKLGFLGFGNIAQAMARGLIRGEALPPENIFASAKHYEKLEATAKALGVVPCRDNREVAERADIIIAAVKPHLMEEILSPLLDCLRGKLLLTVASGWDFQKLEDLTGPEIHHLSLMPNTPVSVGEGVVLLEERNSLTAGELETVKKLLSPLGTVQTVPAAQMDAAGKLSGCGPAYAAMFLEALGDAGVRYGLPRSLAYHLAAQTLAGTGKLQLETGEHPAAMKDAVCSPGGTTIRGVYALERAAFRAAVISAVEASFDKKS